MSKEIERRFLNFERLDINNKLKELGAQKQGRIRDEGFRRTFTIKEKTKDYDLEHEVTFDNFKEMDIMLSKLGLKRKHYSEKIREIYKIDDGELIFDHYPGLPGYIEIEAPTEAKLKELAEKFNLNMNEKFFNYGMLFNELYGMNIDFANNETLRFDNVKELLSDKITKNNELFTTLLEGQKKLLEKVDH